MRPKFLNVLRQRFRSRPSSPNPERPCPVPPASSEPTRPHPTSTPPRLCSPPKIEQVREQIWNEAYEKAKQEEPKLVGAYEEILFAQLAADVTPSIEKNVGNIIAQDANARNAQMKMIVEIGLKRTEKDRNFKGNVNNTMQLVKNAMDFLTTVSKANTAASVAWAGVVTCMEIISNPISQPGINLDGINHVLERIQWYWELAKLLLYTGEADQSVATLQLLLKEHIVKLNTKLLLYQMQSVCMYNKSRLAIIIQDTFMFYNWQEMIDSIKKTEDLIRQDVAQHDSEILKVCLRSIENSTAHLAKDVKAIGSDIRDQTGVMRQIHRDELDQQCLRDLYVLNPINHKRTIENTKGGLLKDSYSWVLEHEAFSGFINTPESKLLWIKGDPGKGKTMLLCGMINEMEKMPSLNIAYFFCQATQAQKLRDATAVIRSLMWLLCVRHSQLISHVRERYDVEGKNIFENNSSLLALMDILISMLQDPCLRDTMFIIDALDECTESSREQLISLIVELSRSCKAKWIVSSRNWPEIEEQFQTAHKIKISLELNNDTISKAVNIFIKTKVEELSKRKRYDAETKTAVLDTLCRKANDTFLWVALVCTELARPGIRAWNTIDKLNSIPEDLGQLYGRMLERILDSDNMELCRRILATVCVAFRLLDLNELRLLVTGLKSFSSSELKEIIGECGSFLTTQEGIVYFVHQSARDFLLERDAQIFPSGLMTQHCVLFQQSLDVMGVLERNMYNIKSPGMLIDEISRPRPDPLLGLEYSCVYWVDHIEQFHTQRTAADDDDVYNFIKAKFLHWLEALSLQRKIPEGVKAVLKLRSLVEFGPSQPLRDLAEDMRRFVLSFKQVLDTAPLQVYMSALLFSPAGSQVKHLFRNELPNWVILEPEGPKTWDACIQTLEGHTSWVTSVEFSPNGQQLASGSLDGTVRIFDAASSHCIQILRVGDRILTVAFSPDGQTIVVGLENGKMQLWDVVAASCVRQTQAHERWVSQIKFSPDGKLLVSCSPDGLIKWWDPTISNCVRAICNETDRDGVAVSFSANGLQLVSTGPRGKLSVCNVNTGESVQVLDHGEPVWPVAFLPGDLLVSAGGWEGTIKVWDTQTGVCTKTLLHGEASVASLAALSLDNKLFASGSNDATIKLWNPEGACVQSLKGHRSRVTSLAFSAPRQLLASASLDHTLKIWDLAADSDVHSSEHHSDSVRAIVSSPGNHWFASASASGTVKVWLTADATCIRTFEAHKDGKISSLDVSTNGQWLLSKALDTVKVWDTQEWECVQIFHNVKYAIFSPNSHLLALGFFHQSGVILYDISNREAVQELKIDVDEMIFSSDNRKIAVASGEKANIYNVSTGEEIQCVSYQTGGRQSDEPISIALSDDSKRLAVGTRSHLFVWNIETGELIHEICHGAHLVAMNAKWLVYCAADGKLYTRDMIRDTCTVAIDNFEYWGPLHLDSNTGSKLYTNYGTIDLEGNCVRRVGYGLTFDKMWIIKGDEKLVWLPFEYRPTESMVLGSTVVIGCVSGRILLIKLGKV